MRGSRVAAGVILVLALAPAWASAQAPTPSKQKSEAMYREGIELAKSNKIEAALAKFEEARAAAPNVRATFQVARMEQALNREVLALFHYRQALAEDGLPTTERSEAVKAIDALKTKVGVITIESPAGASITVDGNPIADPKQPVEVAPGSHVVKAALGGESRVAETKLDAGKVAVVKLSFDEPTAHAPPNPTTAAPSTTTTPPIEQSYWTPAHIGGVGLAGLAVVSLGLTAFFIGSHESNISDQKDLAPRCVQPDSATCRSFNDHGDSADTAKTFAIVSVAVSVASAAGAALLLWPRSTTSSSGVRSTRIALTATGITVFGAF
ncbi:MAG: hypothetical protein U0270_24655 [Labilithrix sp.]